MIKPKCKTAKKSYLSIIHSRGNRTKHCSAKSPVDERARAGKDVNDESIHVYHSKSYFANFCFIFDTSKRSLKPLL